MIQVTHYFKYRFILNFFYTFFNLIKSNTAIKKVYFSEFKDDRNFQIFAKIVI